MQKAIGFIACISVMAASLHLFSGGDPSRILSAQTESATADGYGSVARRFMNDARQHARNGNFAAARRMAETAASLSGTWEPGEQTPDEFLAELDAQTSGTTPNPFAVADGGDWSSADDATNENDPFFSDDAFQEVVPELPPLPENASLEMINKHKATRLMQEARIALNKGDYTTARARAMQARSMNVAWGLWDKKPEELLAEVDQMDGTTTFMADGTTIEPVDPSKAYEQAKTLLHQAKAAIGEGNLKLAAELATQADSLDATYELFEDSPESIRKEVARLSQAGAVPAVAFDAAPATPDNSTVQAQLLLQKARSAMNDGRLQEARTMAQQASGLNVTYGLMDDRPELVLADVQRAVEAQSGANPFATQAVAENTPREVNPFAESTPVDVTPATTVPSGVVAIGDIQTSGSIALTSQEEPAAPPTPANMDPMAEMDPLVETANDLDVRFSRLRTEVLNSTFRASRLKEKDGDEALAVLKRTMDSVTEAQLPEESTRVLMGHLQRAEKDVNSYLELRAPIIANERRNQNVREQIKSQIDNQIRIEQEFADLTNQFNELLDQRRYAEAELIAKKAYDLDPDLPEARIMVEKAKLKKQVAWIEETKEKKAEIGLQALNSVDEAFARSINDYDFGDVTSWRELSARRKSRYSNASSRTRTESERRIEESLHKTVSLHFHNQPLTDVIRHIAVTHGINIALDTRAIETEGLMADMSVSIDVNDIKLESALNLLLDQAGGLVYDIDNEVLKITNRLEQDLRFETEVYPVADLVVPLGLNMPNNPLDSAALNSQSPYGMYQVADDLSVSIGGNGMPRTGRESINGSNRADFSGLIDLIRTTVEPGSWGTEGGGGDMSGNENTLSLVIRQTPKVHDQIVELLGQLRKLQDLQVTVEVRFISVSDRFFERIGVDFDFNVQDSLGDPPGTPAFGSRQLTFPGGGGGGGGGGGQGGDLAGNNNQGGQQGAQSLLFDPLQRVNSPRDDFSGQTVGLASPDAFTEDYDIQFRQGSFELGVPDFGNFNPDAGIQVGMAILSDIEAFFFIQAAQADERANVMFAPKVTLFNGQQATIIDVASRPFVVGLIPVVGTGAVGFQPIITQIQDGITLQVVAVISADRRFVRLSLGPTFNNVVDVFTFSFASGGAGGGAIGGGGGIGGGGIGGGGIGGGGIGGGGGFGGGGGIGGGGFGGGFGGIGGQGGFGGGGGGGGIGGGGVGGGGGIGGQAGQAGQAGAGGGGTLTVQQPVQETISVITTVSVPDGGTVLLGGIKRLREGRNMAGVPILNKIPYVSRLFKNSGVGRETESVMLMVTPRIIIHEEEEELILGSSGLQ